MVKKLIFIAFLTTFAIASASAQTKVDKYIGTWKMVSQPKNSKLTMITFNVSVEGGAFKVEKTTEYTVNGKDSVSTVIYSYKLNGETSTTLLSRMNDYASIYLRYLPDDRLLLGYDYNSNRVDQNLVSFSSSAREYWSLSGDGKTLTVSNRKYSDSSKFGFAKQ